MVVAVGLPLTGHGVRHIPIHHLHFLLLLLLCLQLLERVGGDELGVRQLRVVQHELTLRDVVERRRELHLRGSGQRRARADRGYATSSSTLAAWGLSLGLCRTSKGHQARPGEARKDGHPNTRRTRHTRLGEKEKKKKKKKKKKKEEEKEEEKEEKEKDEEEKKKKKKKKKKKRKTKKRRRKRRRKPKEFPDPGGIRTPDPLI